MSLLIATLQTSSYLHFNNVGLVAPTWHTKERSQMSTADDKIVQDIAVSATGDKKYLLARFLWWGCILLVSSFLFSCSATLNRMAGGCEA